HNSQTSEFGSSHRNLILVRHKFSITRERHLQLSTCRSGGDAIACELEIRSERTDREFRELCTHLIWLNAPDVDAIQSDLRGMIGVQARDLCDARCRTDHVLKGDCLVVRDPIALEAEVDNTVGCLAVVERADRDRNCNVLHANIPIDHVPYGPAT